MSHPFTVLPKRNLWRFLVAGLCLLVGIGLGFTASLPPKPILSAAQLAKALNLHYWYFTVPPHDKGSTLHFEVVDGEKVKHSAGSGGIPAGKSLFVTLRRLPDSAGKFECSIQGRSFDSHFVIDVPAYPQLTISQYLPDGEEVKDQPLFIGSRNDSISTPYTKVREGDVLIRLVMKKKEP